MSVGSRVLGSSPNDRAAGLPSGGEMVAMVDQWAGYIRARVRSCDVDDVMQTARETILARADVYDRSRGEPGTWVFGIVRVTVRAAVRVDAARRARTAPEPADDRLPDPVGDPLLFLVEQRDVIEWTRLVAEAATVTEWRVIVAFARTEGSSADVAVLLGTRASTVRAARGRVAALTRTAIAALAARDAGLPITLEGCVPAEGGYAALLPWRWADPAVAAVALGISPPTFRTRKAMVQRLDRLVHQVAYPGGR